MLTMYREAMLPETGRNQHSSVDNVNAAKTPKGNAKSYTLSRLQRDHSGLFARVCDGELSANAAAIEAGFRRKTFQVPVDDVEKALEVVLRHYGREDILGAVERMTDDSSPRWTDSAGVYCAGAIRWRKCSYRDSPFKRSGSFNSLQGADYCLPQRRSASIRLWHTAAETANFLAM